MITNNGKILCNDCGKKLDIMRGITFGVSRDGEHFCLDHYKTHFNEVQIHAIEGDLADRITHPERFKKSTADYPYMKKAPRGIINADAHFKLQGTEVVLSAWAKGRSDGRR